MSELFKPGDRVRITGETGKNSQGHRDQVGTVLDVGRHLILGKVWVEIDKIGVLLILESDLSPEPAAVPANARLNAAAPDLLAALERILADPRYTGDVSAARAAIAKARGSDLKPSIQADLKKAWPPMPKRAPPPPKPPPRS